MLRSWSSHLHRPHPRVRFPHRSAALFITPLCPATPLFSLSSSSSSSSSSTHNNWGRGKSKSKRLVQPTLFQTKINPPKLDTPFINTALKQTLTTLFDTTLESGSKSKGRDVGIGGNGGIFLLAAPHEAGKSTTLRALAHFYQQVVSYFFVVVVVGVFFSGTYILFFF